MYSVALMLAVTSACETPDGKRHCCSPCYAAASCAPAYCAPTYCAPAYCAPVCAPCPVVRCPSVIYCGPAPCGPAIQVAPMTHPGKHPDGKTPDGKPDGKKDGKRQPPVGEEDISAPARLIVTLPEDAKLTVDGNPTTSTSGMRVFESPSLEPGKDFHYTLKATVVRDGKPVEMVKTVPVRAGVTVPITLTVPASVAAR